MILVGYTVEHGVEVLFLVLRSFRHGIFYGQEVQKKSFDSLQQMEQTTMSESTIRLQRVHKISSTIQQACTLGTASVFSVSDAGNTSLGRNINCDWLFQL